jgi:hypothetical protein
MRRNGKSVNKSDLPEKFCLHCGRPFAWRKKWERDWDSVTCCSEACKGALKRSRRSGS